MAELADPGRWEFVREVFGGALELDPGARAPYLRHACAGDPELRREIESLLEAHQAGHDFLAEPATAKGAKTTAAPDEDSIEGRRLGAYKIERCIGRGGMGTVYSAARADATFEKRVAIKLLKPGMDTTEVVRRFQAERQILAALEHPNIARLLDGGTMDDGRPYLVMEYVEGLAIDAYCDAHQLKISDRLELFRKVCAAVQFAHRNLVVHRDLKPSNILVSASGEPKLLDFGIAKILAPGLDAPSPAPTETLLRLMTPDYASPEQILGNPVTTASDVHALGVLLYLLLSGRHPFRHEIRSPVEVLWAIRSQDPEPPSRVIGQMSQSHAPGLPNPRRLRRRLAGDLDNIVLTALRKEPERRYATVDQLAIDLGHHLTGRPVSAGPDSLSYRYGKLLRRHRLGVLTAAVFIVAVLGFGILMAIQRSEIASERDRLDEQRLATETERLRAERVTAFLIDLFAVADPFSGPVNAGDVTARQLLDRGAEQLAGLGGEPETRADLSHVIGTIYRRIGLSDKARPLLTYALRTRQAAPASDPVKLADSLDQQGLSLREGGHYTAAEESIRQSIALRRSRLGNSHPTVANSLGHLAILAAAKGDFDHAERLQREALTIYRTRLDGDNAIVASGLRHLAHIVLSQGDHENAERLYSEALTIQLRLYGNRHLQVARTRFSLAELILRRGDNTKAETFYRQALVTMRQSLGDEHIDVALAIHGLAMARFGQSDYETAEELYRQALVRLKKLRGDEHPDLVATLNGLGRVLLARRNFSGAEDAYREGLEIRRKALGEASPYLVINLTGLSRVALEKGDYTAAEAWLRQALEIGRQAFPDGHWRIDMAQSLLGECRLGTGRYTEAERLLLESYQALRSRRGPHTPATLTALDRLIDLYQAWNRPEEGEKYRLVRSRVNEPQAAS